MEETFELIQMAHQGDKKARDTLVQQNMGLVYHVAKRFLHRRVEKEDLYQIGAVGLMKAIDRFDLNQQVKFSTYAVPVIMGEIRRYLRDDGMIKVSRSLKENAYKIHSLVEESRKRTGKDLTIQEISLLSGMTQEEILMAMEMEKTMEIDSIYRPVYKGDGKEMMLGEQIQHKKDVIGDKEDEIFLNTLLEGLEGDERKIINYRYFKEKTQCETAKALGVSQVQVSRLEKKILEKLRRRASLTPKGKD